MLITEAKDIEPLLPSVIVRVTPPRLMALPLAPNVMFAVLLAGLSAIPTWKSPPTVMPPVLAGEVKLETEPIAPPLMVTAPVPKELAPLAMTLPALSVKPPV